MKRNLSIGLAPLLLALAASAQSTWHVDVNAPAPGNGSPASPFPTIQQALDNALVGWGDLVLVAPGVYAEQLVYPLRQVTVRSQAGPLATRIEPVHPTLDAYTLVELRSTPGSAIEGFTISGAEVLSSNGVRGGLAFVRRCVITANKLGATNPGYSGIGIASSGDLWVESCTVSGNAMGTFLESVAAVYAHNSIFAGNPTWDIDPQTTWSGSTTEYSLVGSGAPSGPGNLGGDPQFWSPPTQDFQLMPTSPCIDAGDPSSPLDPDGSRADMGALTFDPVYCPVPFVYCTAKLNSCGALPVISSVGVPHAGVSSGFTLATTGARAGKAGLVLYSSVGPGATPFQGGTLCIATQGLHRGVAVQATGGSGGAACDAVFTIDWAAFSTGLLGGNPHAALITVGQRINVQWWGRDDLTTGSLLSAAIQYAVCP